MTVRVNGLPCDVCGGSTAHVPNCSKEQASEPLQLLTILEYQQRAYTTAVYPQEVKQEYCPLGFLGEIGEVANKYKKVLRGDLSAVEAAPALLEECGDVLWYIAGLCTDRELLLHEVVGKEHFSEVATYCDNPAVLLRSLASAAALLMFDGSVAPHVRRAFYILGALVHSFGGTLQDVAEENLRKLAERKAKATLQGQGDKR